VKITSTYPVVQTDASAGVFTIQGESPVNVTNIYVELDSPAAKDAVSSEGTQEYVILADIVGREGVQNVRVLTFASSDTMQVPIQEWYGLGDKDQDGDIDAVTGTLSRVPVGRFTLETMPPALMIGISKVMVAGAPYCNVTCQREVSPPTLVESAPESYAVSGFYPNPFNPSTTIRFSVPADSDVLLAVYDITGRLVAVLEDGHFRAGTYTTIWNARNDAGAPVSSGLYLYRLSAGTFHAQGKVMFLK
jgi:hypothetical protein